MVDINARLRDLFLNSRNKMNLTAKIEINSLLTSQQKSKSLIIIMTTKYAVRIISNLFLFLEVKYISRISVVKNDKIGQHMQCHA